MILIFSWKKKSKNPVCLLYTKFYAKTQLIQSEEPGKKFIIFTNYILFGTFMFPFFFRALYKEINALFIHIKPFHYF